MDGFTATGDVVVIAASNLLEKLDPALLRPGRFDRQIFVSPPDVGGRERILQVHSRGKPVDPETSTTRLLARQTSGLTGADLANICNEAAIYAARRGAAAWSRWSTSTTRSSASIAGMQSRRTLTDHERRVVAYHEAGHALCGELLPSVDPVHRISIVPRGRALGYTLNLPEEDRYLKTREELIDLMTMLLGGRAAEELVFGSITTGAADDLRRVAEIAHAMVHEYAMGTGYHLAAGRRRRRLRGHPAGPRRGGPRAGRRGLPRRGRAARHAPARSSTSSPPRCWPRRSSSATTSTGSWPASPTRARQPAVEPGRPGGGDRGQPGARPRRAAG